MTDTKKPMNEIREYKDLKDDYAFNPDIMSNEPERTARVKWIIDNILAPSDKIIILMYADCASYRKLARRLGVSHMTIQKVVKRIKAQILKEYERLTDNNGTRNIVHLRNADDVDITK